MSDKISEAQRLKGALKKLISETVRAMPDFNSAFRVYKAVVTAAPNGQTCGVRLTADTTALTLPYSTACADIAVGDFVFVGVIGNSLSSSVVWQKVDFS